MFKKRKTVAENPFRMDMLPHDRKALWLDVVKLHYLELVVMGLTLFVFALPLLLNMLATNGYIAGVSEAQYGAMVEMVSVSQVTSALVNIPLLAIFAVGLSGVLRVCRQYAWGEVVTVSRDFALGIKQNWKQTVALLAVFGTVYASCVYADVLAAMNPLSKMQYVASAWTMIAVVFLLPIGAYMLVCLAVYNNTFWQNFTQGFALLMKVPFRTLGGVACFGGLFALFLIPNTSVHFALAVILLLGAPFLLLGWFLFSYNQLDKFVNAQKHPQLVNKGLYLEGDIQDGEDESL